MFLQTEESLVTAYGVCHIVGKYLELALSYNSVSLLLRHELGSDQPAAVWAPQHKLQAVSLSQDAAPGLHPDAETNTQIKNCSLPINFITPKFKDPTCLVWAERKH